MVDDNGTEVPLYRDKFTPAQRRRVEALIMVKRLWPYLNAKMSIEVAAWLIRGNRRTNAADEHAFVSRPRKVSA